MKEENKSAGDTGERKVRKNIFFISDAQATTIVQKAMEAGWLLWIKTSAWGNRKTLAEEMMREKFQDDADAINAIQRLIDAEEVKAVTYPMGVAVREAKRRAKPWFHDGVYWLSQEDVEVMEKKLQECKDEVIKKRKALAAKLPELKVKAKKEHPKLYSDEHYPTQSELENKFNLIWGWTKIRLPFSGEGTTLKVMDKAFVEKENQKYVDLLKQSTEETVGMWRIAFLDMMKKLRDKLVNPKAKFKDITVERPKEFLAKFKKEIESFGDKPFAGIINDLEEILSGVDADDLRDKQIYRAQMGEVISDVVQEFETLPTVKMRRALKF